MKSPKTFLRASRKGGFTFIEVLVVLALVAFIAGMGLTVSFSSIFRSNVVQERDLFVSLLIGARARSLANVDEVAHGVHIEADRFVIFKGTSYSVDPDNLVICRSNNTTTCSASNVTLEIDPPSDDVVFAQLSANVSAGAGTVTLTQGDVTQTIIINEAGLIDW